MSIAITILLLACYASALAEPEHVESTRSKYEESSKGTTSGITHENPFCSANPGRCQPTVLYSECYRCTIHKDCRIRCQRRYSCKKCKTPVICVPGGNAKPTSGTTAVYQQNTQHQNVKHSTDASNSIPVSKIVFNENKYDNSKSNIVGIETTPSQPDGNLSEESRAITGVKGNTTRIVQHKYNFEAYQDYRDDLIPSLKEEANITQMQNDNYILQTSDTVREKLFDAVKEIEKNRTQIQHYGSSSLQKDRDTLILPLNNETNTTLIQQDSYVLQASQNNRDNFMPSLDINTQIQQENNESKVSQKNGEDLIPSLKEAANPTQMRNIKEKHVFVASQSGGDNSFQSFKNGKNITRIQQDSFVVETSQRDQKTSIPNIVEFKSSTTQIYPETYEYETSERERKNIVKSVEGQTNIGQIQYNNEILVASEQLIPTSIEVEANTTQTLTLKIGSIKIVSSWALNLSPFMQTPKSAAKDSTIEIDTPSPTLITTSIIRGNIYSNVTPKLSATLTSPHPIRKDEEMSMDKDRAGTASISVAGWIRPRTLASDIAGDDQEDEAFDFDTSTEADKKNMRVAPSPPIKN